MRRMGGRVGGRADRWADGRTGGRGLRADERTGERTGGRADEGGHAGWTSGRGRTMGGQADRGRRVHGREDGLADWRTGGRRISEGKTPNLTHQLTWPWKIQHGRPRVTVKLSHLPPPSR